MNIDYRVEKFEGEIDRVLLRVTELPADTCWLDHEVAIEAAFKKAAPGIKGGPDLLSPVWDGDYLVVFS